MSTIAELESARRGLLAALEERDARVRALERERDAAQSDAAVAWSKVERGETAVREADQARRQADAARRAAKAAEAAAETARRELAAEIEAHGAAARRAHAAEQRCAQLQERINEQWLRPGHLACRAHVAAILAQHGIPAPAEEATP